MVAIQGIGVGLDVSVSGGGEMIPERRDGERVVRSDISDIPCVGAGRVG